MKLLCVSPTYWPHIRYGGPIFSIHGLNRALVQKGIDVSVYTISKEVNARLPLNKEIETDGVKITYFDSVRFFDFVGESGWQLSLSMRQALKEKLRSFDLVHINAIWNFPIAITAFYCRHYGKRYLISPRGALYPYTLRKRSWKKIPYFFFQVYRDIKEASAIHYTSIDEAERCHVALRLRNRKIVIPNGIDYREFADLPGRDAAAGRYPCLKGKKRILFLGRVNWKKGLDILIEAYGRVAGKRADAHLLIVGGDDGGYRKKVEGWVKRRGIHDRVTFTGMMTGAEKLSVLAGSDLFVLPSYSENFGMSVVEAMACGIPVIVSTEVGIRQEIINAKAGLVIKNDAQELCEAMIYLLERPDLCRRMGDNGRLLVKETFALDRVSDEMIKAYEDIMYSN